MHGNGHCSHKKVSNGQVYDKVCRTLAQVTISCESENGKTVYNRYHSQFNDKDCEPSGPEHWEGEPDSVSLGIVEFQRLFKVLK